MLDRLAIGHRCLAVGLLREHPAQALALLKALIGGQVVGAAPQQPRRFLSGEVDRQGLHDLAGDLVLHVEDLRGRAVVALGPALKSRAGVHQLGIDPQGVVTAPDAALKHVIDIQLLADLLGGHLLAFEGEGGIAREDP